MGDNGMLYDRAGNEYRAVTTGEVGPDAILVYTQIDEGDGDQYDGELRLADRDALHAEPPKAKVDAEIAGLNLECIKLREKIWAHREELDGFEKDADDRMAKLKQHKALGRLDDFLAGKITHFVEDREWQPPAIIAAEDATTDQRVDRHPLRLLTLFGKTNGDLEWGLNEYSGGSGHNTAVTPCVSLAEALEVVERLFAEHVVLALGPKDTPGFNAYPCRQWVTRAVEYSITLDPEYVKQVEANEAQAKQAEISKLVKALDELRG